MRYTRFAHHARPLLALVLAAALQGCTDEPQAPSHPIVGRYTFEATLEKLTRATSQTCGDPRILCTESVSPNGATLSGVLTIPDTITAHAELDGYDPYYGVNGRRSYEGPFYVVVDPVYISLQDDPAPSYFVILRDGKFEGDSIVGEVHWQVAGHRNYYVGTYVAKRIANR